MSMSGEGTRTRRSSWPPGHLLARALDGAAWLAPPSWGSPLGLPRRVRFTPARNPPSALPPRGAREGMGYAKPAPTSRRSFRGPAGDVRSSLAGSPDFVFCSQSNSYSSLPSGPYSENTKLLALSHRFLLSRAGRVGRLSQPRVANTTVPAPPRAQRPRRLSLQRAVHSLFSSQSPRSYSKLVHFQRLHMKGGVLTLAPAT